MVSHIREILFATEQSEDQKMSQAVTESTRSVAALDPERARGTTRSRMQPSVVLWPLGTVVATILIWQLVTMSGATDPIIFPSPAAVGIAVVEMLGTGYFWDATWSTMQVTLLGFVMGVVIAWILGTVIGHVSRAATVALPALHRVPEHAADRSRDALPHLVRFRARGQGGAGGDTVLLPRPSQRDRGHRRGGCERPAVAGVTRSKPMAPVDAAVFGEVAQALRDARRPVLLAGMGAERSDAGRALAKLADLSGAWLTTTLDGM